MTVHLPIIDFSPDQRELWQRVMDLWALSQNRDESKIRSTLHPDYVGWDMSTPLPHGREFAVHSVSGDSPEVREYALKPLSVQVYEEQVGVVHYSYSATIIPKGAVSLDVTGRWSEVYLKQGGVWLMISISGRPDVQGTGDGVAGRIGSNERPFVRGCSKHHN
ncbi:nuclear transport factor 2 family protein [Candidatus Nitrotoga sp. 1052]|uniref:nuclear transport factor 2 family protein n=1 Tax=Candidatus Nitrotoga sp. 1052 TaxID=2886964 RepID=UPI001EF5A6C9|nr:nuclear transport factor 2 family protein [Candidatus Nitrotoga sp. 1052]CAH1081055.1 conserved hypothetical protein [Candidatus Nitrotoga sp. 1052]